MRVLTSEQMQRVDAETIATVCPGVDLMERAGRGCAEFILHEFGAGVAPGNAAAHASIFCGAGNNGGDGLVIARWLAEANWSVSVHLFHPAERLTPDAQRNHQRLMSMAARGAGVTFYDVSDPDWIAQALDDVASARVLVDAMLGTGVSGSPRGALVDAIRLIGDADVPVVSVDIPSGVNGSTGETPGEAVMAAHTLTIGAPKIGTLFHPGRQHCGRVHVIDIGFPDEIIDKHADAVQLLDLQAAAARLPYRAPDAHKFGAGILLVVAGSRQYRGAALLAAEAGLRSGAGMVYLGVPASIHDAVDVALREAITVALPETADGTVAPGALATLGPYLERAHALVVGPGLGRTQETDRFVEDLVRAAAVPVVMDADAIHAFAGRPAAIAEFAGEAPVVLTPHAGELARLLGESVVDAAGARLAAARDIAGRFGVTLVYKGAPTLVSAPGEDVWINTSGSSALATGGTGDVLAGLIGGMLAQGASPLDAALVGCLLHGRAGEAAAEDLGKRGAIAGDLLWAFGPTMAALEALAGE